MNLLTFKTHIKSFPDGTMFNYGISYPFSWRGSYDEVAFSIIREPMSKKDVLERIETAYSDVFHGWKGGEYEYSDDTIVNFEQGSGSYSDGDYVEKMISAVICSTEEISQEETLVKLVFIK